MLTLFALLFFLSFFMLIAGLINPKWLSFLKIPKSRISVLLFVGIPCFISLIALGAVVPDRSKIKADISTAVTEKKDSAVTEDEPQVKYMVEVKFLSVKKVDGDFRYFFTCKNNGTTDFKGNIEVELETGEGLHPIGEKFNDVTVMAGGGHSFYLDGSTGVPSYHGESGIIKFNFKIVIDDEIVNSGTSAIPDKVSF